MTDLKEWCEYIRSHPLKLRFDGLHSRGRSSKSDFFTNVREAAMADESFMSDRRSEAYDADETAFDAAVASRSDDTGILARFCEYVEGHVSHRAWATSGLPTLDWDKAPIDEILKVVTFFSPGHKDSYLWEWCVNEDQELCESEEEYLLKDHPPIAAWCNAGDYEIKLEDVFFLCPSCSEPQTEEDLKDIYGTQNGYPHFYCGGCGSEMSVGPKEHILDFFNAMGTTPYPFNTEKQAHWKKLMSDRKAWGENKLELKVGETVHLKTYEDVPYENREGTWRYWKNEPGELVTIAHVTNTESWDGDVKTCAGIVTEERGFVEFHNIHSRPKEAVTA